MKKNCRSRRRLPAVLTSQEQELLLAALPPLDKTQERNLAMVLLMLDAGLRSAEVVGVRHLDLQLSHNQLMVHGKGGRDRILWLPDAVVAKLTEFVQYSPYAKPGDLVFQTSFGNPVDTRFLRTMVAAAGRRAGIAKRLHPHMLRHTFASDLLRQTGNIFLVMKALGHSDISTTTIYLHLVDGELENAMKEPKRNGG